jgi:hypothetical protein
MVLKRTAVEVEEMRERKKQKNRESAQRARDRFKAKMRWLEDQVRHITERHDNLLRENTYMRHMLSEQTQKLNLLLQRENEEMEKERRTSSPKSPQSHSDNASSGDDSNDSGIRSLPRSKNSSFSIGFLSKSSKNDTAGKSLSDRITSTPSIPKPTTTNAQGSSYPGMVYPTAIHGFLPHQVSRNPLYSPGLASLPAMRLSPGGTMHMEKGENEPDFHVNDEDEDMIEDEEIDVDVGSPLRSDSDLGTLEHSNSSADPNSDDGHSDH